MSKVSKAVIPVAGLGTRFLPATKALPKEMLPVVDKPAIQYVVEESVESGISQILFVTGRNKNALENHFDRAVELESLLEQKGDFNKLGAVSEATDIAEIHYVRQGDPLGLGHAVLKARTFVGNEPFAVLLGDDLIHAGDDLLSRMKGLAESSGKSVVALMEFPLAEVSKYGVADIEEDLNGGVVRISSLVEKPSPETAPSNYVVIGRYVLQPSIFDFLDHQAPGYSGEIQLTDAINAMAHSGVEHNEVLGIIFEGRRFDTGDKISYLKAIVEIASERADLGPDFNRWLQEFIDNKTD